MADSEGFVYFAAETGKQMNSELQIRVTNYEGGLIFILSHSAVRL